ncbi:universal stress protein [Halostagnicola sp. A-GB9-2]|uniref:universal stress protein n=1 Tax=Halostagnicola sp. A-GB9-2 TaxID=3048066 RepID=UPI0031F32EBB
MAQHVATEAGENVSRDHEAHGRHGNPAEEIIEFANETDAHYIVIGGRKRSPVGKALFGSVTQSVLLDATQPVVAAMQ